MVSSRPTARVLGRWGELVAAGHLTASGYRIIDRNYRWRFGEIDLIALDAALLVFIEVKTRRCGENFRPETAVNRVKKERIGLTAAHFLFRHPELAGRQSRFDLVAIEGDHRRVKEIRILRAAWMLGDGG